MQLINCKTIKTYDRETGLENGWIIELLKDGNKTKSYMNVLLPKAFKGYHIHTERTNKIYCLGGEVAIYLKEDDEIKVIPMSKNNELLIIPPETPTAIENLAIGNSVLLFFTDPPFDPANTHEMIPANRKEVENVLE